MKLNYDCVRDILLYVEKKSSYDENTGLYNKIPYRNILQDKPICKYSKQESNHALDLLIKEGFLECAKNIIEHDGNIYDADIIGLSWLGHEFLNEIRNDTIWHELTDRAKKLGGSSIRAMAQTSATVIPQLMADPNSVNNLVENVKNIVSKMSF